MKTKQLLAGSTAILVAPFFWGAAGAQSTGTQDVETVVVTGARVNLNGLMNAAPVAKERSVITSEFLATQPSGQTVFQALNFMPGINFTNNDPYGTSGGNIRMHGQDGNHISLTLDGMPLNDTGNYAIYTNQMLDPEVIDRISALQGATDVDSPTAAATGGVINITSDKPHDTFGVEGVGSGGSFNFKRFFGRVDSGTFGPWNTTAFAAFSYEDYDKFKGAGSLRKIQGNVKLYQDLGDIGWFAIAGHWNINRNNAYYGMYYAPSTAGYTSSIASQIDLVKGTNGGYAANPLWSSSNATYSAAGWDRDTTDQCVYNRTGSNSNSGTPTAAPVQGTVDYTMTTCSWWDRMRTNPSDTGNIRFTSLWRILPDLTLTVDANLQYVLATGGTLGSTFSESDYKLIGSTYGTVSSATTTTPYGCIAGKGCDLNGDGDILDTVLIMQPSVTNTRRWGFSTSLIYQLTDNQTFQLAYTLDYGLHRQTGQGSFVDPTNGPYTPFGAITDSNPAHKVLDAAGVSVRFRDRKSKAIMNQAAFDWEGNWLDGMIQSSIGFRLPFFERDLNQYCYESLGGSTAYCTTMAPSVVDTVMNTVQFGTSSTKYVPGGSAVKRYTRFLPHLGLTLLPLGKENQFFATYTQEIAAPRTDNLYSSGHADPNNPNSPWVTFAPTKPETSTTYQIGYRYLGEDLQTAVILWNSQVKNRIVSTYDPITNTYFDHNVKGVNFWGVDLEANYRIMDGLTAYANVGYDRARITTDLQVGGGTVPTLNMQLSEVPKWTMSGRVTYDILADLNVGIEAKYVSRRNQSEDNVAFVPDYYTVNFDARYDLDALGMDNASLRFNVDNLFDKHYFGSLGTVTCFTPVAPTTSGCTSLPYAYVGSPRTFQGSVTVRF